VSIINNWSHATDTALDAGYRAMAADTAREAEAQAWCNALAVSSKAGMLAVEDAMKLSVALPK